MHIMRKKSGALTTALRVRFRRLYEDAELTQDQFAERAGSTQSDVSRFLTGQMVYPPLEFLDGLAKVFGLRLSDLIAEAQQDKKPAITPAEFRVLRAWAALPPDARAWWVRMAETHPGRAETSTARKS